MDARLIDHRTRRIARTAAGLAVCLLVGACGPAPDDWDGGSSPVFSTGQPVELSTSTIGDQGGSIRIDKAGDPLHGLTVTIPQGACTEVREFRISYRPILAHTLPAGVEPVLPLISIDDGGLAAEEIITLTIPVAVPEDSFVMAFHYSEESGTLEAMRLLAEDATSIKVATRHFSSVTGAKIKLSELEGKTFPTGFTPGTDDWPFENRGSYITPRGNCGGMCLAAMWYYDNRRVHGSPPLRGDNQPPPGPLYDNAGLAPDRGTPTLTIDDDDAIRLCSVVQKRLHAEREYQYFKMLEEAVFTRSADQMEFYQLAAALKVTKQPQLLELWKTDGPNAHAVICHKLVNNTLHIADPNFPGESRTIELQNDRFKPYLSADTSLDVLLGALIGYDRVSFLGRSCLYRFDEIASHWTDLEAGDIGHDLFPRYWIRISELDDQSNLVNTYGLDTLNDNQVSHEWVMFEVVGVTDLEANVEVYDFNSLGNPYPLPLVQLRPGDNLLGFHVRGKTTWTETDQTSGQTTTQPAPKEKTGYRWLGFDWINVVYEADEPEPVDANLARMNVGTISVMVEGHFEEPPTYDWQGTELQRWDSEFVQTWKGSGSFQGNTFTATWNRPADPGTGEPDDLVGNLSVTIDPQTYRVLTFNATKTGTSRPGTDPPSVTTVSIRGGDVPLDVYLEPPRYTPYMLCYLEGEATCERIAAYQYRIERGESEWFTTVAPYTEMTGFTCSDMDYLAAIAISFKEE